ncbi:MAG: bifunctional riboflavin kinase/FAD synthetase [Phormidesmis sp.]
MWITSSIQAAKSPVNIALGNFDGVHLGHRRVMAEVTCVQSKTTALSEQSVAALHSGVIASGYSHLSMDFEAIELPVDPVGDGLVRSPQSSGEKLPYATVMTFSPHPQEYFSGISKQLLTPVAEKTWQLTQLGIQQLVMLPFDRALAELSPEDFVEQILIKGLRASRISVGSDFRFGKGRSGNAEMLKAIAAHYDVPVVLVPLKQEKGDRISSSRIRQALQTGELEEATHLLGRPYTLTGRVVKGKQLGRTIGFPTANLQVPAKKYLPRTGVYSVQIYGVGSNSLASAPLQGVMNIGNRPTVEGQSLSIEVHLLNWTGDLYGRLLTVSLEAFVRPEQKFNSLEELKAQITVDCEVAIASLG